MSGFYLMHRGWMDNDLFGDEPYTEQMAWCWLIENAAWKETKARIKGESIFLQRGQMCFAIRFLADKWGWSKSRADRFLRRLMAENMIEMQPKKRDNSGTNCGTAAGQTAGHGTSIITICNYSQYQDKREGSRDNDNEDSGTASGQNRDKEEQKNKLTKKDTTGEPVAFAGSIINLKQSDFDKWQKAYPSLDLRASLQSRDDWLAREADEGTRRKWFLSTSNWLANRQTAAANAPAQPKVPL